MLHIPTDQVFNFSTQRFGDAAMDKYVVNVFKIVSTKRASVGTNIKSKNLFLNDISCVDTSVKKGPNEKSAIFGILAFQSFL